METTDYEIHPHCINCIKSWSCKMLPQEGLSCAIVNCQQACGARFHRCKGVEHRLLCPNEKIPCLNSRNGCPAVVYRKGSGSHLATCPASVVYCPIKLNHQDGCVANICTSQISHEWMNRSCDSNEQPSNSMPIHDQLVVHNGDKSSDNNVLQEKSSWTCRSLLGNEYRVKKSPPGLEQSICKELLKGSFESNSIHSNTKRNQPCSKIFRRDEYSWHYKNIHSELLTESQMWIKDACPAALYGCNYFIHRFYPNVSGSLIVYDDLIGAFAIQYPVSLTSCTERTYQCNLNLEDNGNSLPKSNFNTHAYPNSDTAHITDLPFEVLQDICRHLDSFSLCNVSKTCHFLREVCFSLLEERGVVTLQWNDLGINGSHKWKVSSVKWFFSTATTPIKKWVYEKSESMGQHFQSCPHYEKDCKLEPFFYPSHLIEPDPKVLSRLKRSIFSNLDENSVAIS